jgi:hypothetical protein
MPDIGNTPARIFGKFKILPLRPIGLGPNNDAVFGVVGAATTWEALDDPQAPNNLTDYVTGPSPGASGTVALSLAWPTVASPDGHEILGFQGVVSLRDSNATQDENSSSSIAYRPYYRAGTLTRQQASLGVFFGSQFLTNIGQYDRALMDFDQLTGTYGFSDAHFNALERGLLATRSATDRSNFQATQYLLEVFFAGMAITARPMLWFQIIG